MQHLPNELLFKTFEYTLEEIQQILVLQQTCKRFYNIINQNDYLWYFLFKKIYPRWSFHINYAYNKQPLIDWKRFVLELYQHKQHYTTRNFTLDPIIKTPYKIEDPFMYDMSSGMIALGKYKDHEYKISFFSYPSYAFLFEHTLNFTYGASILPWTCQMVGLQTVQINNRSIQLCAVALGQPIVFDDEEEQDILDTMDPRLNIWRTLLIYRIDHHTLTCLAHINMEDYPESRLGFLGREVFFFSPAEQAWTEPWLDIISPDHHQPGPGMAYMLAFGPNLPRYGGRCYIVQFDVDGQEISFDPIQTALVWNPRLHRFIPHSLSTPTQSNPARLITTVQLGSEVSCMYHFRHTPQLHHLICTGNYDTDEVSIWDWRFGIKVGLIPGGDKENIQPWGFETTWAIPTTHPTVIHGPRMIVVGDFEDKFEIKTWDISHLLTTVWDPFSSANVEVEEDEDMPFMYAWWHRGTNQLKYTATHPHSLPYTISHDALLKVHELDAQVKYTAYSILQTLLYLLNAEGQLVAMDIESGHKLASTQTLGMGVDVNVLGNKEIIITRKHELLRCLP